MVEGLKVSKGIRKRLVQELKHIYLNKGVNKVSLLKLAGYTASQMKGDLRLLIQEGFIIFSAKEKIYLLSSDIIAKVAK